MVKRILASCVIALVTSALVTGVVYAVSINWGASANPIYDETGIGGTVLANGDIVQLIWDQAGDGIDPPASTGVPTGDDQLLASSSIGTGTFFPGRFSDNVNTAMVGIGNSVYGRAWNAGTFAGASHYGDSPVLTIDNNLAYALDSTANGPFATATPKPPPLAATLEYFTATPGQNAIDLEWQTVSEIGCLGFNLLRSEVPDGISLGNFVQLNELLIACQAIGSSNGATYEYIDQNIELDITYYYWLEAVEVNGTITHHGPVSATVYAPTAVRVSAMAVSPEPTVSLGWIKAIVAGLLTVIGVTAAKRRSPTVN